MVPSPTAGMWAATLGLLAAAAAAVAAVLATGGPALLVGCGTLALAVVSLQSWLSGGRFSFAAAGARPLGPHDPPAVRAALLAVCERAGRPPPQVVVAELDVPGAAIGYAGGDPVVAVDPLLPRIVGPEGLRAIFAHELGHLRVDIHTDAVRAYLPQTVGFGVFWTVFLAGRGPAVAAAGTAVFLALAPLSDRRAVALRWVLSLGAEAVARAVSRYANRQEEYRADAYAAALLSPESVASTLVRLADVARGDNAEDVAGPFPWRVDRSRLFGLFATHPSVEDRVAALSGSVPTWAGPGPAEGG